MSEGKRYVGESENDLYHSVAKVFGMSGKGVEYDQNKCECDINLSISVVIGVESV